MLTLEQITAKLQDRKPKVVAEETGLAYYTVWRVQTGRITAVSYDVVRRLSDYLTGGIASESKVVNG